VANSVEDLDRGGLGLPQRQFMQDIRRKGGTGQVCPRILRFLLLALFHFYSVLAVFFMLLSWEGQASEVWELSYDVDRLPGNFEKVVILDNAGMYTSV
jgi:hypothetical protein